MAGRRMSTKPWCNSLKLMRFTFHMANSIEMLAADSYEAALREWVRPSDNQVTWKGGGGLIF